MSDTIRSYTNSDGMSIEVTKEHLDRAVEIKLELQESSPSRRCPWNKHKKMMESEGFDDSDTSEAYRCLIKSYQKEINKLAPVYKYANYVAEGKLDAIKQAVGEMYYEKQDNQSVLRELNKIKKGLTTTALAVEELRQVFIDDVDWVIPHYAFQPRLVESENKLLVNLSDPHIGLVSESWNYEVLLMQFEKYKQSILDYCKVFNVNQIYVAGLGDVIDGAYNRGQSQAFNIEFGVAEQVNKATKVIIEFLTSLAEYVNVEYIGTIFGNHDRLNGNAQHNIDGDSASYIIHNNIVNFIELANIKRLKHNQDTLMNPYEMSVEINGKNIKFVHGDSESRGDGSKIKKHMSMDNTIYDILILGHLHHWEVFEENDGRMEIYLGCLPRGGAYSRKLKFKTKPSQGIVVFTKDDYIPIRVDLDV